MGIREVPYQDDYLSGYGDLVEDFFRPSLSEAQDYWRAVGYFSSSALEAFGAPLGDFISGGGHIRLVASVELSTADIAAIQAGSARKDVCGNRLEQIIQDEFTDSVGPGVARLARLIEFGRLEIRIAVPKNGTGIYHEKIGIFHDGEDYVAFTGSANESRNAFENNRECIDTFLSWVLPGRARRKLNHFTRVWDGTDAGVDVFTFPEAAKQKLLRVVRESRYGRPVPEEPTDSRWRHQDEAVQVFLNRERGVLNMATGTGKTRTALKIMRALFSSGGVDRVVVTASGTDLLQQWYGELLSERDTLPVPVRVLRDYSAYKESGEFQLSPDHSVLLVSRQASLERDPLASVLRRLTSSGSNKTLLIHDEVHSLGSPGNRERLRGLSSGIRYRLGLSATPDRAYDSDGNAFIEDHVGPVIFTFGLGDAIRRGVLSPFNYHPLLYHLTDEDRRRLRDVRARHAARVAAGEPATEVELWIELAKVYKTSPAKLPAFDTFIGDHQDLLRRCLIFVETQVYGLEVLDLVHKYRADFRTYFTGEESDTLRKFASGELECLLTCHRLSEGIDIKSLNTVVLFSSSRSPLETIQRMGRCLRADPQNPGKIANVVDFIRESDETNGENTDQERSAWLTELSALRAEEE